MARETKNEDQKQRIRDAFQEGQAVERMPARYIVISEVLAPGTHSHSESGKFSQFWPEPGTNPAQWVRLKTPFRVHPKQPN